MHRSKLNRLKTFRSPNPTSIFSCKSALSLTGSASRTDLSQLANGIWEIHAGCPSFLCVSSVAKIGYIPQFKASNARDQDEVSSDLARTFGESALYNVRASDVCKKKLNQEIVSDRGCFLAF